jgi:hypothetical protein
MAKLDPLDITWLVHLLGAVVLLVGVGLRVYNLLSFQPTALRLIWWEEGNRLGAAVGAVLVVAGLLLRRVR